MHFAMACRFETLYSILGMHRALYGTLNGLLKLTARVKRIRYSRGVTAEVDGVLIM